MEIPQKELDLARNLVKCYPQIDGSRPSAWTLYSNDFEHIDESHLFICHAKMALTPRTEPGLYDQLLTAMPHTDPVSMAYLNWLVEGPFRRFADRIHYRKVDGLWYIHVDLADFPANVMYNFCIATRGPIEWKALLTTWDKLIQAGVSRELAFLCARFVSCYTRSGDDMLSSYQPDNLGPLDWQLKYDFNDTGHIWLDFNSDWGRVISGNPDPTTFKDPYKVDNTGCRPTNRIWGYGSREFFSGLKSKTAREVLALFDVKVPPTVVPPTVVPKTIVPPTVVPEAVEVLDEDFDDDAGFPMGYDEDEVYRIFGPYD